MKRLLLVTSLLVFTSGTYAQDPNFTCFTDNLLYFNSAEFAINPGLSTGLTHRTQWASIPRQLPGNFNTSHFYLQSLIGNQDNNVAGKLGAGITFLNDVEGEGYLKTTQVRIPISGGIQITDHWTIGVGIASSYIHKSIDWDKLLFSDQLDPLHGVIKLQSNAATPYWYDYNKWFDLDAGIIITHQKDPFHPNPANNTWNLGISCFHIDNVFYKTGESFYNNEGSITPIRIVGYFNGMFDGSNGISYLPGIMYQQQMKFKTIFYGSDFQLSRYRVGIWLRHYCKTDALAIKLAYDISDSKSANRGFKNQQFSCYYSYDITISKLGGKSGGSHEIGLRYSISKSLKRAPSTKRSRGGTNCDSCPDGQKINLKKKSHRKKWGGLKSILW